MRWIALLPLLALLGFAPPGLAAEQARLSLPPASLAQWYKPANKRQVWLHTMFNLRRSMQAVSEYAALEQPEHLAKWSERFVEAYLSLPKMVPEWRDEVESQWAERLRKAGRTGDYAEVGQALRKIGTSCRSCHNEYQAVSRALYRSPDFKAQTVELSDTLEELPYDKLMGQLSNSVNRIKIALEDQQTERAQTALEHLRLRLTDLGNHCANCHRDAAPKERILGPPMQGALDQLAGAIAQGDAKAGGRLLGEIGVGICARCHGTHRSLSDLRALLAKQAQP